MKRAASRKTKNSPNKKYRVTRFQAVGKRYQAGDLRCFYCDKDIDIVVAKISKRHLEPSHLHTQTTETYYVINGRLNMTIAEEKVILNNGDLVTIYPGICHSFSTSKKQVLFLAIKKHPLLQDKKRC